MMDAEYRVTGIRNSKTEGWFTPNCQTPCATARIEINTPLGTIIAEVAGDSAYPGVYLSFRANGSQYEQTVALLEAERKDSIALKVWEDERKSDSYSHYFPINTEEVPV